MKRGICVAITGPTASGKTTAVERLLELIPGSARLVTTTTRQPRPKERDGVDYHFLTREEFLARAEKGEFLEFEENYGNLYGSSRVVLDEMCSRHCAVFTVLDVRGARTFKAVMPETVTVYLRSPLAQIRGRLERRPNTKVAELERRLDEIRREDEMADSFDHIILSLDGEMEAIVVPRILEILGPMIL